eukprot:comp15453_c0_seq1/m.12423 comp15453_c0_seq1/g.12423  ORF comp15453_c0_seq1/g.12423 comp15453_c0_seq1/m.12423 type:complete len:487 (-) comp15453_c0_seq1:853-2313(-)
MKGTLLTVAGGLYVLLWYVEKKRRYPPGPFSLPMIGDPLVLWHADSPHEYSLGVSEKYGRTYAQDLPFGLRTINTTRPENIEHILKTNFENYIKGKVFRDIFHDLLGNGIFNVNGEQWRQQRKAGSRIFTTQCLRDTMFPVFVHHAEVLRERCVGCAEEGTVVDVQDMFFRLTLDALCEIAYGKNIGALEQNGPGFWAAFDEAQNLTVMRFLNPLWRFLAICGIGSEARLARAVKVIDDVGREIIEEKRARNDQDGSQTDLLSQFMRLRDNNNQPFDDKLMRDIIINFMLAGRDTTAVLMTWAVYRLCIHPDMEEKILTEIENVGGGHPLTYEDMNRLEYMQAFLMEVLRLHPSVPRDTKLAVNDDIWPDGTFVPAGTTVNYQILAQGRLPEIWGDDASEFKPERFLGKKEPSPYVFPQFNAGPRTCLGKGMAYLEAKAVLSTLIQSVRFELIPNQSMASPNSITLLLTNGLKVGVHKRDGARKRG